MENIRTGPRDFFMHLFAFGMLYVSAVSLISLWFQYINIKFSDPLQLYYSYGYEQIRWPMAALIVVFPVFLFLARWMSRQIAFEPERKELKIYKWLVYFTLFVSAITVVVDLVTLIYNFLGGELTARFGLKVLVVLVVALWIFGYYLWHLRADIAAATHKRRLLLWTTAAVVLISIVLGFVFVGSPATARARRFDEQRIMDLQNIQYQIANYWQRKGHLPVQLSGLRDEISGHEVPMQPRFGTAYNYRVIGELSFELCADFETEMKAQTPYPKYYVSDMLGGTSDSWDHGKGRVCFERTIDPTLYPRISPKPF